MYIVQSYICTQIGAPRNHRPLRVLNGFLYFIFHFQGVNGWLCGGYSDVPWGKSHTKGAYMVSDKSFLFSLSTTQDTPPIKYDIVKKPYAICYHQE